MTHRVRLRSFWSRRRTVRCPRLALTADPGGPLSDRDPIPDLFPTLAFRSTKRTVDRLAALRSFLVASGAGPLVGEMTRADVLRLVVEEGLTVLERRARRARGSDD